MNTLPSFRILLVEDNLGDVRLTREALEETEFSFEMEVVDNGERAIHFLKKSNGYEKQWTPDLILLDLNLPRKSGHEVLGEIKSDALLKRIPVIVLTTSDNENDVTTCYDLHVNSFVCKPIDFGKFSEMVSALVNFWCREVLLPPRDKHE